MNVCWLENVIRWECDSDKECRANRRLILYTLRTQKKAIPPPVEYYSVTVVYHFSQWWYSIYACYFRSLLLLAFHTTDSCFFCQKHKHTFKNDIRTVGIGRRNEGKVLISVRDLYWSIYQVSVICVVVLYVTVCACVLAREENVFP